MENVIQELAKRDKTFLQLLNTKKPSSLKNTGPSS